MEIAVRISASQFWGSNLVSLFLVLYVLALFSVCTPTTDTFLLTIHLKSLSKSRWFYCVPPLDNIKLDRVSKFNTTFFSVLNTVKFHSFYQMYKNIKFSENFFFSLLLKDQSWWRSTRYWMLFFVSLFILCALGDVQQHNILAKWTQSAMITGKHLDCHCETVELSSPRKCSMYCLWALSSALWENRTCLVHDILVHTNIQRSGFP